MRPIFFQTFFHWEPKMDDGEEIARGCREKLRTMASRLEGNYKNWQKIYNFLQSWTLHHLAISSGRYHTALSSLCVILEKTETYSRRLGHTIYALVCVFGGRLWNIGAWLWNMEDILSTMTAGTITTPFSCSHEDWEESGCFFGGRRMERIRCGSCATQPLAIWLSPQHPNTLLSLYLTAIWWREYWQRSVRVRIWSSLSQLRQKTMHSPTYTDAISTKL